jgi:hypothetical protein
MVKMVIGTGGTNIKIPQAVLGMDQVTCGCASMYKRRNAAATFQKFMAHQLIAQKRHPQLMEGLFLPTKIEIGHVPTPKNAPGNTHASLLPIT